MMRQHVVFALGAVLLLASIPALIQSDRLLQALGVIFLFCGIANIVAGYAVRSLKP